MMSMTDSAETTAAPGQDAALPVLGAADEQLVRELAERARAGGLKLTGQDGLLGQLTKMVLEGALEGEMDDHLGYGKHDPAGRDGGNSRNGHRAKTVLTDTGPVQVSVPRDRDASFEPKIVAKRQRRLTGVDELVISLSAKGLTHGEISAHLAEVYGAEVSRQTITTITDRVMDGMAGSPGPWIPLRSCLNPAPGYGSHASAHGLGSARCESSPAGGPAVTVLPRVCLPVSTTRVQAAATCRAIPSNRPNANRNNPPPCPTIRLIPAPMLSSQVAPMPSHRIVRLAVTGRSSPRGVRSTDLTVYATQDTDTTRISVASTARD
jgi:Transposase, Mutator family